jgi:putative polyhydroxyalkanoate system protein
MPNLTVSIPHQLGRAEAKRRIESGLAHILQQYGGMLGHVEQHWEGDTLELSVTAMAQTVTGRARVEEQVVNLEMALPWMLSMLAGRLKQGIEQQGRALLGHKPQAEKK